jgi:hypothetical protein
MIVARSLVDVRRRLVAPPPKLVRQRIVVLARPLELAVVRGDRDVVFASDLDPELVHPLAPRVERGLSLRLRGFSGQADGRAHGRRRFSPSRDNDPLDLLWDQGRFQSRRAASAEQSRAHCCASIDALRRLGRDRD